MGAAAAEHEDQAGNCRPVLHLPPSLSSGRQSGGDAAEGYDGGAEELDDRAT